MEATTWKGWSPLLLILLATVLGYVSCAQPYYGKYLGKLKTLHHGVTGEVYAVDARTLHIRDFSYDGEGPAAYFWAGDTKSPSSYGFKVNDEKGSPGVLPRYRKKHVTLTLPDNKTLRDIKWFSVWCDEFAVNFGDVKIPKNFDYPKPQKIDALNGAHLVSSDNIVVVDAQTLLVPNFSYDGEAPDAKFWVGRGNKPGSQGTRVADENGLENPLRRYERKTVVLTLPGDMTVQDIGHFGVWCEAFAVDFGHVRIPRNLNVPPSLKMLGVSAQSKLNCEVLKDDLAFEARWAVAGDSVVIQLVGKVADGDYMAFGLSSDLARSRMVGGDVTVAWVDHATLAGGAKDYFLDDKSQCSGGVGTCPDTRIRDGTESVRLLNAALVNGYSIVTYQRSLHARDELDLPILTNQSQAVIWAVGPLNARQEASYHHSFNKHNVIIDFARSPRWNCPLPDSESSSPPPPVLETTVAANTATASGNRRRGPQRSEPQEADADTAADSPARQETPRRTSRPPATPAPVARAPNAWHIPAIECDEPDDGVFYAQMGPTGGKRGYPAITGHVGWGISWYINGLLIPEINVVRGKTYTFVTEGGNDPEYPAKYHPFYITDDPVGGYEHKTPEERAAVRVFAGIQVSRKGEVTPTGTGRLCNWTPDPDQPPAEEFASFGAYQRTLSLVCDTGEPGVVTWTPGPDTPDTVYYQCYSHRYLGWKINVLDRCDTKASGSELVPSRILPAEEPLEQEEEEGEEEGELQSRPSIRVSTVVKPNGYFINDEKNAALKGFPDSQVTDKKVLIEGILKEDKETNTNSYLKSHEILNPPQADFKDLLSAVESGEAEKKSNLDHFSKESFNYSQQNYSLSESKENQTYQSTLNSEEAIQKLSLLQSSQHSDHGGLNLADPRRKPIIHATTPYSVMSSSNEDFSSSTHIPMDTQDNVQDLKVEFTSTSLKAQESPDKGNANQKPNDKFSSDSFPLNDSNKQQIYFGAYKPAPHTHTIHNHNFPTTLPHTQMIIHKPHQYLPPLQHPIPHRGFPHVPRPGLPGLIRNPYITTTVPQNYISGLKKPLYRMPPRPVYSYPFQRPFSKIPISPQSTPVMIPVQHRTSSHQNKLTFLPTTYTKLEEKLAVESTSTISTVIPSSKDNSNQSADLHDTLNDKSKTITVPVAKTTEGENIKLPIAINTGFHPESVVVEGGFKPIIQKKEGAQDRSSQGGDTDRSVEELETETKDTELLDRKEEELISELVSETNEDKKENIFEGQQPELFEPIFIPSPPDRITNYNHSAKPHKNTASLPHDLTPPVVTTPFRNRKPNPHPTRSSRPGLRRPVYPTNIAQQLRAPSPSFRFQQILEDSQDETAMAAERLDTYYLPPVEYHSGNVKSQKPNVEATIPPGTVVTYDGKSVVDVTLASSITNPSVRSPNNQNPSGTAALIRETPQFGPFRGEIPPPVPEIIQPDKIPQLRTQNLKKPHVYPIQLPQQNSNNYYKESSNNFPDNFKTTQLSLVRQLEQEADSLTDDLMSEASEIKEFSLSVKSTKNKPSKKVSHSIENGPEIVTNSSELSSNRSENIISQKQDIVAKILKSNENLSLNVGRSTYRTKRSPLPHHHPSHTDDNSQSTSHNHEEHMNVKSEEIMDSGAHHYQALKALVIVCLGIYLYL